MYKHFKEKSDARSLLKLKAEDLQWISQGVLSLCFLHLNPEKYETTTLNFVMLSHILLVICNVRVEIHYLLHDRGGYIKNIFLLKVTIIYRASCYKIYTYIFALIFNVLLLGSVHTTSYKIKNAACLPSRTIRHENTAFRKSPASRALYHP